jgi:triphosphoribosyl-dephospho-CoA synthase
VNSSNPNELSHDAAAKAAGDARNAADPTRDWSPGQFATLACLLEAAAPKPGNVHRGADFEDLTFVDLSTSAVAVGAAIDRAAPTGRVGATALAAVAAMRAVCESNAYLGTILLISPLAHVPRARTLAAGLSDVLANLTAADSADVYEAIRISAAGALGKSAEYDIASAAPRDLLAAMRAAADRDLVARQFVNGYAEVFGEVVPLIESTRAAGHSLTSAIVHAHIAMMSRHPDSLIARKCGAEVAAHAAALAQKVVAAGAVDSENYMRALGSLDFWLRSDHHRRNPGTTADLIAAALFALLRDGRLPPPWR